MRTRIIQLDGKFNLNYTNSVVSNAEKIKYMQYVHLRRVFKRTGRKITDAESLMSALEKEDANMPRRVQRLQRKNEQRITELIRAGYFAGTESP